MRVLLLTSECIHSEDQLRNLHKELLRELNTGVVIMDGRFRSASVVEVDSVAVTGIGLSIPSMENGKII